MHTLSHILDELRQARDFVMQEAPDLLDQGADFLGHLQTVLKDAAQFLRNDQPVAAGPDHAAQVQELQELRSEVAAAAAPDQHTAKKTPAAKVKAGATAEAVGAGAIDPALKSILAQLLVQVIDSLLGRLLNK